MSRVSIGAANLLNRRHCWRRSQLSGDAGELIDLCEVVLVDPFEVVRLEGRHADARIDHVRCELESVDQDDPSPASKLASIR
jgi:hypothetical protein